MVVVQLKLTSKDGDEVVIREPCMSDARALMRYINSVIREGKSGIVLDRPVTLKQEEEWLRARLDEMKKRATVMLVAELDGKIVGNCHISRKMWKERHRALVGVALMDSARGKGIGRALMQHTMDLAIRRMRGIESFELSVLDFNERAQALYRSLGFREVGRIPQAVKEEDGYADEMIMVLRISDWKRPRKTMNLS